MDIYNPARVKHAFFPRCSLCGRLWLRARPSLRTQYVAMHVISPFSGIVNSQKKQASCRNNFAIILQGLLHTPFASMFLQLSLCDHPASSDLHSHVVECQCVYILLWNHVYMYVRQLLQKITKVFFAPPLPPRLILFAKALDVEKIWIALFGSLHFNIKLWGEGGQGNLS